MIGAWMGRFSPAARRFLAGALLLELGHAFLWALQNLYVRSIGYGEADAGLVLSAGGVGVVLSTLPSATIYERLGARRSLTLAAGVAALAIVALAQVTSLPALVFCSALQGAAFTLHRVVSAPFLVSVAGPGQRTRLFGAEFATQTLASTAGLALAGLAAGTLETLLQGETAGLRWALALGGLLSLTSVQAYRRLPEPQAVEPRPAERRGVFTVLAPGQWHLWWRLAVPNLCIGLGAGMTIPFINLYFTDRFGVDKEWLGFVMAASQLTMTVGVLAQPRLVDRIGLLRATLLTEALSLPFFLTLAFTSHLGTALVAFVIRAALMNLSHPVWRQLIMEVTPGPWRAAVNGVAMLAWNLGWATSNHIGGALIEHSAGWISPTSDGYALPMLITIGVYVLAIGLEARFFWHQRHVGMAHGDAAPEA